MAAYPRHSSSRPMREFAHGPIGVDVEFTRFLELRHTAPDSTTWRERHHNRRGLLARLLGRGAGR